MRGAGSNTRNTWACNLPSQCPGSAWWKKTKESRTRALTQSLPLSEAMSRPPRFPGAWCGPSGASELHGSEWSVVWVWGYIATMFYRLKQLSSRFVERLKHDQVVARSQQVSVARSQQVSARSQQVSAWSQQVLAKTKMTKMT